MKSAPWLMLSVLAIACGGGGGSEDTTAKNPSSGTSGDCPAGMTKEGGECVAPSNESGPNNTPHTAATATTPTDTGPKTPYDKDTVDMVFGRAVNQAKANCGSATDENGKATGPWGTAKVTITLGRNGHVHGVSVPDPYNGKPVGTCIEHAFQNVIFPPYAAPADVTIDRDVELHPPAK